MSARPKKSAPTIDARDSIAYALTRYVRLQKRHFVELAAREGYDLTSEQWMVLNRLHVEGPANQVDLGERIFSDRPNMTRMLATMERKRLVRRRPDPEDGRRTVVELTRIGEEVHERMSIAAHRERARLFDGVTAREIDTVKRVLRKLEEKLISF